MGGACRRKDMDRGHDPCLLFLILGEIDRDTVSCDIQPSGGKCKLCW